MTALLNFILALIRYPEVQERAHQELARVVGYGRLPDYNDRVDLPYISAIVKEVLRWQPVARLGTCHCIYILLMRLLRRM